MIFIKNLFNNLLAIKELQGKLKLIENKIVISFHDEYKLEINDKLAVSINNIFYEYIDDQDILEFIKELATDCYVIMKKKKSIFEKSPFTIRYKAWFEKKT